MDEFEMKRRIYGYIKEICHYSQMQVFATSYYQKNYFQLQMDDATGSLINLYKELSSAPEQQRRGQGFHYRDSYLERYEQTQQAGEQDSQQPSPDTELPSDTQLPLELEEAIPRSFTEEELAYYDGKDGKPAYVAVKGIVYDVSSLVRWAGGEHFGMKAGRDLSSPFMGCHQGVMDRLNKLPQVGVYVKGV